MRQSAHNSETINSLSMAIIPASTCGLECELPVDRDSVSSTLQKIGYKSQTRAIIRNKLFQLSHSSTALHRNTLELLNLHLISLELPHSISQSTQSVVSAALPRINFAFFDSIAALFECQCCFQVAETQCKISLESHTRQYTQMSTQIGRPLLSVKCTK